MLNLYKFVNRNILLKCDENECRNNQLDILIPPVIICSSIYFSTFGYLFTIIFLFIFLPVLYFICCNHVLKRNLVNFYFYTSWSVSSFLVLIIVFEFIVVPFLEITIWENYAVLLFVSISLSIILLIRYQNRRTTNLDVLPNRVVYFNPWISANVYFNYYKLYLISLTSAICALLFGTYLSVTTICHTHLVLDFLLVPDDCSEVYFDINLSLSFVCAIYATMLSISILYSLVGHIRFVYSKMGYNLVTYVN